MDAFLSLLNAVSGFVWGPYMLVLLVGTGIYLTLGLRLRRNHSLSGPDHSLSRNHRDRKHSWSGYSHLPGRSGSGFLDVGHGLVRHGHQVR